VKKCGIYIPTLRLFGDVKMKSALLGNMILLFKPYTGRKTFRVGNLFVKSYNSEDECMYEWHVLSKMSRARSALFRVPDVFRVAHAGNSCAIIMEFVKGIPLQNSIEKFILYSDLSTIKIFFRLGKALKELHSLNLEGLHPCAYPSSLEALKLGVVKLAEISMETGILGIPLGEEILDAINRVNYIDERIFTPSNIHGEFYFTHVVTSGDKFVFFDFHNACRGPSYFDIGMFITSLYVSLTLPYRTPKLFEPLVKALLLGYYGEDLANETLHSVKVAELYVALRELLSYMRTFYSENSPPVRIQAVLKAQRLIETIRNFILPPITTS